MVNLCDDPLAAGAECLERGEPAIGLDPEEGAGLERVRHLVAAEDDAGDREDGVSEKVSHCVILFVEDDGGCVVNCRLLCDLYALFALSKDEEGEAVGSVGHGCYGCPVEELLRAAVVSVGEVR